MDLDVLFLHPPTVYDFRRKCFFPGPLAETVSHYTTVLISVPVGFISMADYLARNGCKTKVVNLGERMVVDADFDVERFLRKEQAAVYGIDLHWVAHCQGAIEVARLCKRLHPNSLVVLGGLTSTCFHREIIEKYPFIDAVIRGEGEQPIRYLLENLESSSSMSNVPNLTFRDENGGVRMNDLMKPCGNLDQYEFSRVDLVEPNDIMLTITSGLRTWVLPICRGCECNCVSCGGSAYSYKKLFGRESLAFRSPQKLVEDIQRLKEHGVDGIFLFQDPRMGGRKYVENLVKTLRTERIDVEQLGIELFAPASKRFLEKLGEMGVPLMLNISPESASPGIRRVHGRDYSNEDLMKTIEFSRRYKMRIAVFFMIGLALETWETIAETWRFCEKLYQLDRSRRDREDHKFSGSLWVKPRIGPMLLLDPGSLAFDFPELYGYKLIFRNLEDYYRGLSDPSWHTWISYETQFLSKQDLVEITLQSLECLTFLEERYAFVSDTPTRNELSSRRFKVKVYRLIMEEVNNLSGIEDIPERDVKLDALKDAVNEFLSILPWSIEVVPDRDPYGYRKKLNELMFSSAGLMTSDTLAF